MFRRFCLLLMFCLLAQPLMHASAQAEAPSLTPTASPESLSLVITSPAPGQALQGAVPVAIQLGSVSIQFVELAFAYSRNPTGTWFLIFESTGPVNPGELARWDTTTLTDGEYSLRLVAVLVDGGRAEARVEGLRVRNYTPIETDTPTNTPVPGVTPVPTATLTPIVIPTDTPIPPTATLVPTNPAVITPRQAALSMGKGALAAAGLFALLGLYSVFRSLRRRR
jgi:hypothetical protein